MDDELISKLKYLRLWGLFANWDRYLEMAGKGKFSQVRLLKHIIEEEYKTKKENARKLRLKRARIPEAFVMETFPFDKQPKLSRKKVLAIYDSFDYLSKRQNVIWIGPTGTGKTGLATAFLIQAINHGYSGRFIEFPELIELLYKSVADHSEAKLIKTFTSYDCLVIDELGYVEVESVQVGLFFTLMHKRHRKKTTLITSNLGFQEWTSFLKNDQLTAALIDRLTENSHVINMKKCASLRPRLDQT
ncbi:MAG: ATP-binding protein [Deltaproteobacteria bacterium]|nr:ATP-binding protein [Deltaproteobacteria bacterium]